ncbi:unnamed protein product [Boreogadus saida]
MVSLPTQSWEKERGVMEGEEGDEVEEEEEVEEERVAEEENSGEASVATDDSEPEWEPDLRSRLRRKVSFADAFGLDLVSVKEFDAAPDLPQARVDVDGAPSGKAPPTPGVPPQAQADSSHLSCLFSVPSGPEELRRRLWEQKVELESIELLPGTSTLRGVVRVENLCYCKAVYVRVSPDGWRSHFELPAAYVPGSSDRETDRFAFIYALETPVRGAAGTRMEFCLRYETEVATFWANNRGRNYVLFCHQKARKEMPGNERETEESHLLQHLHKHQRAGQRSCLKANRRGDAEDRTYEVTDKATTTVSEDRIPQKAETAGSKKTDTTETLQEDDLLIDSVRSRRKAARLSRVKDLLRERSPPQNSQAPAGPHQNHHHPTPDLGATSDGSTVDPPRQKQPAEGPKALPTYHQIPLLTLDWTSDTPQVWPTKEMEELWSGVKTQNVETSKPSTEGGTPSKGDPKKAFTDAKVECRAEEGAPSVCDIWQSFIDGGGDHSDHSGVPESVWLQKATSMSPPSEQRVADPGTPSTPAAHRSLQAPPDTPHRTTTPSTVSKGPPVSVSRADGPDRHANNSQERRPAARAWVGSRDVTLRPEGSAVTETPEEEAPSRAGTASTTAEDDNGGSEDGVGTRQPEHVAPDTGGTEGVREQKGGGGGGGGGGDGGVREPLRDSTGDRITSSGERGTTEMTAAAAVSQNASACDRISRGAAPGEGLSQSGGEGEEEQGVSGIVRNAEYDTLAFREAFKGQGTKGRTGSVLSPFRRRRGSAGGGSGGEGGGDGGGGGGGGEEEVRLTMPDTEGKGYTGEEIFRPRDTVNTERSQREAGDKDCEGFGPNKESGTASKHKGTRHGEAAAHTDAFEVDESRARDTKSTQSHVNAKPLDHDTSALCDTRTEDTFQREERKVVGVPHGTGDDGALRHKCVEVDLNQEVKEDSPPNNENSLQPDSFETDLGMEAKDLTLLYSQPPDHRLDPITQDKERRIQGENPGMEVLTKDLISTEPGLSTSSPTEAGARENNNTKLSPLKQESCGVIDTDNTLIKNTSVQAQPEVLSEKPSLKGLEDETGTGRDDGDGEGIKPFQTDDHRAGPSHASKHQGTHHGEAVPHTDAFEVDESRARDTKSTQSHVNANDMSWLCDTIAEDMFQRKERKVDGVQHGTSNDGALRLKCVEVDLNQEVKEGSDSPPNNGNSLQPDSLEADLMEVKYHTLMYSEAPEYRLDPMEKDKEPQVQSEVKNPVQEGMTKDPTSGEPGSLRSSPTEEGARENNDAKLSALKQESGRVMDTDNIRIKYTPVQTQGEVSGDIPSLKGLEVDTAPKRDEGEGLEIQLVQTGSKCFKEGRDSRPNNENPLLPDSLETDLGKEAKDLTLMYSRAPDHRLNPIVQDKERRIQGENPGMEVLTKDLISTEPGLSTSSPTEEGASENNKAELSPLKQESGGVMDADNTQIKYTPVQTQGEVLSDVRSFKGFEEELATRRDEGKGEEMKLFQMDDYKHGPSHDLKHKIAHVGEVAAHTDAFEEDESRAHDTKSTQRQVNAKPSDHDRSALCDTRTEDTFQRKERKFDGVQHGTSNDGALRLKCVEVDLNQEVKEGSDSLPNNENSLQPDSLETDLGKEAKDLTLMYSEAPDHQLEPMAQDKEPHVQSKNPGMEVLTKDLNSTAPRPSTSSPTEGGARENNNTKLSPLKQESGVVKDTDNVQIKYTSVQTQGEVSGDIPSLKGLEVDTAPKRDEGEGLDIKLFQTVSNCSKEGRDSLPNNENPLLPDSLETELGKEAKDLTLMYSEAPDHRLDPIAQDKEQPIQSENPGQGVLTKDLISTELRPSTSSSTEEGAREKNEIKPSPLRQESVGVMDTDNTRIKCTSAETQGVVLSDKPSLKGLDGETGTRRDDYQPRPLNATDSKCKKLADIYLKSEERDNRAVGGITPPDDIFQETPATTTSGVSRDPRPPPETSECDVGDGDGERGTDEGQTEAITEGSRTEKDQTPEERKRRKASLRADGPSPGELEGGMEDAVMAEDRVSFECMMAPGEEVGTVAGGIGEESDKGVSEEVLNWKGVTGGSGDVKGTQLVSMNHREISVHGIIPSNTFTK